MNVHDSTQSTKITCKIKEKDKKGVPHGENLKPLRRGEEKGRMMEGGDGRGKVGWKSKGEKGREEGRQG